jgi:hypothetical protein
MLIFLPNYILLALASWSVLAVPLSGSDYHNENGNSHRNFSDPSLLGLHIAALAAQKRSLSSGSSNLMGRQGQRGGGESPMTTMDCDHKSKSDSKSTSKDDINNPATPLRFPDTMTPTPTTSTGLPTISRRRFRSPMKRDGKVSPSIFERDDPHSTREPITVGDIVADYLKRRAATRKRAMRPKTSRGAN